MADDYQSVPRVGTSELQSFAESNKPCILTDISLAAQVWSLDIVAEMLGDLELTHIFKSNDSKFLFKINQPLEAKTFTEFLQLSRASECGSKYYLYAEPIPDVLRGRIDTSFIPEETDSLLLWAGLNETLTPLHFDICEGVLLQLVGEKNCILARHSCGKNLYPFSLGGEHSRQSQIPNVCDVDLHTFPDFAKAELHHCTIKPGEGLYIPIGWWHQIEAPKSSVSISMRWNPYLKIVMEAFKTYSGALKAGFPAQVAELMFNEATSDLPSHVQDVLPDWKRCFEAKILNTGP